MIEDTKTYNEHTYSGNLLVACQNGYEQGRADALDHCEKCEAEQWDAIYRAEEKARADERERIVRELEEELKEETLGDGKSVSDVGIGLEIALKIVRGGEKEQK